MRQKGTLLHGLAPALQVLDSAVDIGSGRDRAVCSPLLIVQSGAPLFQVRHALYVTFQMAGALPWENAFRRGDHAQVINGRLGCRPDAHGGGVRGGRPGGIFEVFRGP